MLSQEYRRLCMAMTLTYGFTIHLHDASGEVAESIPELEEEYLTAYLESGMYEKIKSALSEDGHPVALTGSVSDIWSGFPAINKGNHNDLMVIGPMFYAGLSKQALDDLTQGCKLSKTTVTILEKHRDELPIMTATEYTRIIGMLYYVLTGRDFDHMRLGIGTHPFAKEMAKQVSVGQRRMLFDETMTHATYSFERYMLDCISEGNAAKLARHLSSGLIGHPGKLNVDDPLRQEKNIFIVSVTLATRAAIKGGLNPEIAFSMSDLFIQHAERTNTVDEILAMSAEMPFEFARRVGELNMGGKYSKDVKDVCRYIHEHIYKNISIPEIASHVYLSTNYISAKFKEETGETITGYIKKVKINEAKSILLHTGLSLPEISMLLNFSSQSFFTTVFKQQTGVTPKQFRERPPETDD